jgi:hypothetical protein
MQKCFVFIIMYLSFRLASFWTLNMLLFKFNDADYIWTLAGKFDQLRRGPHVNGARMHQLLLSQFDLGDKM